MKKIIKKVFLSFIICFTILNIVGIIINIGNYHNVLYKEIQLVLQGELNNEIIEKENHLYNTFKVSYGEDAPVAVLSYMQGYLLGQDSILQLQQMLLIASVTIGISIGLILSLTEKSKIKEIVMFIGIGLVIAVIYTTYIYLTMNFVYSNFWEFFIEVFVEDFIMQYGIYYIISYVIIYLVKYFTGKNNAKKLNDLFSKK